MELGWKDCLIFFNRFRATWRPMAYFTKEVNSTLVKPLLKFNGGLAKLQCTSLVKKIPAQRPVTRSLDVSFDLCLNKRLSKQWWGWWLETPSRTLWRHCNVISTQNMAQKEVCCLHKKIWYYENWYGELAKGTETSTRSCILMAWCQAAVL